MANKLRLDKYLFEKGLSKSREKAKNEIIAGWVKVNGETIRTPSKTIGGDESIIISRPKGEYISRGGYKLEKALNCFQIDFNKKIILDLGASTGGFTDCALKKGAMMVYALDVGYGQLDYSLRKNENVVVMEKTNARNITADIFEKSPDFITADLSFISFVKVYDNLKLIFDNIDIIALIKPQFEAERSELKKGIVKDKDIHIKIMTKVFEKLNIIGFTLKNLTYSPIKGPKGNIEFLAHINTETSENNFELIVKDTVENAHLQLTS